MNGKYIAKVIFAALLAAILAAAVFFLGRTLLTVISGVTAVDGITEEDPMITSTPEAVTRPPELDQEEEQKQRKTLDDYVPEVETPVEKTAEDLAAEAQTGN